MRGITSWRRAWSSAAFAVALFANVAAARTNLSGRVLGADGSPIGGATVFIYEAGPRSGLSPFCPSCYPDCGKHRTTELTGRFVVPSLSDSLVFRVLVIADGFEPKCRDMASTTLAAMRATVPFQPEWASPIALFTGS